MANEVSPIDAARPTLTRDLPGEVETRPTPAPQRFATAPSPHLLGGPQVGPATAAALTPPGRITATTAQERWPRTVPESDRYQLLRHNRALFRVGSPELGAGAHITYAIADRPMPTTGALGYCRDIEGFERLAERNGIPVASLHAEIDDAMQLWARHANITVTRISDPGAATFVFGAQVDPAAVATTRNIAWTRLDVAPPVDGVSEVRRAAFCFNPDHRWSLAGASNQDVMSFRRTVRHESGHGLGLDHQDETLMDFRDAAPEDLARGDILGAQRLYGPPRNAGR